MDTPDTPPKAKKYGRQIILEISSDNQDLVDDLAADMLESLRVMPEAIALPEGIQLDGIYVADPDTGEEIDYTDDDDTPEDPDAGDHRPDTLGEGI